MLKRVFDEVSTVDWQDLRAVDEANQALLRFLDEDREQLQALVDSMASSPELLQLCESFRTKDKLVLHQDPSGWRLRIHIFVPGYRDDPHDHRWTLTTRILHGGYTHTLYGAGGQSVREGGSMRNLPVHLVRRERRGDGYTLHPSVFHSVASEPGAVSLLVRGPSVKRTSFVTNRETGSADPYVGAGQEDAAAKAKKRMSPQRLQECIASLQTAGVLPRDR